VADSLLDKNVECGEMKYITVTDLISLVGNKNPTKGKHGPLDMIEVR
jgi:hypothetical protein